MDQKEFLSRVLPQGKHHYIAYPTGKKLENGRPVIGHSDFIDPDRGVAIANRTGARGVDVWVALAGFKQAKVADPKFGEKSYRKQENVAELKSLFLDLDYKAYGSQSATLEALKSFLDAAQLPAPSIIVHTGGGFHVYWVFPAPLPVAEWQVLANGLAGIAENLGLKADLQCTIDSARILRMPGTHNHKYDHTPLVEVAYVGPDVDPVALTAKLGGVTSMRARAGRSSKLGFAADPEAVAMFPQGTDDLGHGVGVEYKIARMVEPGGCPLFADMLARGGAGDSRELWNNMLLLTAYAEDGRGMAHMLSQGDTRYTSAETDREFNMKLADRDKLGPTTCSTFSACSTICLGCPHFGKIRSPIVLGKPAPAEGMAMPTSEPTWVEGGRTWRRVWVTPEESRAIPIFDMALDRPVLRDTLGDSRIELTFRRTGGKTRQIVAENAKLTDRGYLNGLFGGVSMPFPPALQKPITEAIMSWTTFLRDTSATVDAPPFGWSEHGFSLNGDLFTPTGDVRRVGVIHENASYGVRGKPEPWQDLAAAIIADPRTELQLLLATAFAAPLMEFTELSATAVVLRSPDSGVGKTSVMKLARATYGSPEDMAQANDTATAVEIKLSTLTNMPWFWDELKVIDDKRTAEFFYQVLQGKSKARGRPDGGLRSTYRINGMMVVATNLSMSEIMQNSGRGTDAGALRMFEMDLARRPNRAASHGFNQMVGALRNNNGHAGRAYAAYLAARPSRAENTVKNVAAMMDREGFEIQEQERFWATSAKTIIAGAVLANDAGICSFDIGRMVTCLKGLLEKMRSTSVTRYSPEETAYRIWQHHHQRRLITDEYDLSPGMPRIVHLDSGPVPQMGNARVRLAYLDDRLLLSKAGVEEYAKVSGHHPQLIYNTLDKIASKYDRLVLDKGVSRTSPIGREWLWILKASDVLGADVVAEWVTSAAAHSASSHGSSSGSGPSGSTSP